ncbi:MurR/RpiR family transcriptional regulator [Bacillaceae bacterium Marseille-Q3522]|nr:MurR/RpiR family transcriptional regulator [Bacillaceae bacterium Marseille-Q3522]
MGRVLDRFSQHIGELTFSEKHVLYYVENNLAAAKQQSLTAMAESNNVSTTTIVRMCHKLHLDGFSEFKFILKNIEETDIPIHQSIFESYKMDMERILSSLKENDLEVISEQLHHANRILIVGVGLSKMLGEYFSKLFMQVNKPTSYVYESHIIDLLPNMIQPHDLVVFISSSGETKTIVKAADKIRFKNVDTLAITNSAGSSLSKIVRNTISADIKRVIFAGYDLTARSIIAVLIDLIFEYYLKKIIKTK